MLMIGSQALNYYGLAYRPPRDYDFIATHEEFRSFIKKVPFKNIIPTNSGSKIICSNHEDMPVEIEIAYPGTSAELLLLGNSDRYKAVYNGYTFDIASLNELFALKASHRFKKNTPHFLKTRKDYLTLKNSGCVVTEDLLEFYDLRVKETYNYNHPKLDTSKGEFFNGDGVQYIYDHDTIHLAMANPLEPAYKSFQADGAEVKTSRDKFEALPESERLRSVLEECYVLALERSQIPYPDLLTPRQSFLIALEKVCTSISSGWWRDFAYMNYDKVLDLYSDQYIDRFKKGVESGLAVRL